MNDPGTAEPIKQAADEIDPEFSAGDESRAKEEDKKLEEEEKDYHDPRSGSLICIHLPARC